MSSHALLVPRKAGSLWATPKAVAQTLSRLTGTRRHRNPNVGSMPSRILALRLRQKPTDQRKRYGHLFRHAARLKNERLPIVTFQKLLMQEDLRGERGLHAIVSTSDRNSLRDRLNSLGARGWQETDIDHWVWILSAEDTDARILRLVSTDVPKPLFLLTTILQAGTPLRSPESLRRLLDYISKHYVSSSVSSVGGDGNIPPTKRKFALSVNLFLFLLRRLLRHVQKVWPRAVVTLAQLTQDYIGNMGLAKGPNVYHKRCKVFNNALALFSSPAPSQPLYHMEFNWRAQKMLLSMSDAMERPLIIDLMSYRAIRKVLVAQKKSAAERKVAMRYAKSWPPYRQDFDGHDAQRTPEDDQSRAVRSGALVAEAGYEKDDYDRALDVLGGGSARGTPTIQTRSLAPKEWKGDKVSDNFFTEWAMRIRATRNTQEAWRMFHSVTVTSPTLQIYTEMFIKLHASHSNASPDALPGDSREVSPVHHENYSEYELARLTPPTVTELYHDMLKRGIKPSGMCLQVLVSNARSMSEGFQYFRDSSLSSEAIAHMSPQKAHYPSVLKRIPLLVFKSYIQLLCRFQPDRRKGHQVTPDEMGRIYLAIKLTELRLPSNTPEGATFRPVWQIICRALARPKIALLHGDRFSNDVQALRLILDVNRLAERRIGLDLEIFIYICRTIQKLATTQLEQYDVDAGTAASKAPTALTQGTSQLGVLFNDAQRTVKAIFARITTPVESSSNFQLPRFLHTVTPVHLHTYMRTLALLEDIPGMVRLLRWVFENKHVIDEEIERKESSARLMVAKTLCAFEAFAGPHLEASQRSELDRSMDRIAESDPSWKWPSHEDIEEYIQSDKRGGSQRLQRKTMAAWWRQAPDEQVAAELLNEL
ncbi:hypothetical protein JX266_004595 [Neoarthrinium moseri]|nr:hypothetical protein JX266_004595 [Neoarthrinium moseri]